MNQVPSWIPPFIQNELEGEFEELHNLQLYHSLSGCASLEDARVLVPETVIRAIMNWCGNCTDPGNGPDFFNNPRAMFTALNLIYKLLEELQGGPREYTLKGPDGFEEFTFPMIRQPDPTAEERRLHDKLEDLRSLYLHLKGQGYLTGAEERLGLFEIELGVSGDT